MAHADHFQVGDIITIYLQTPKDLLLYAAMGLVAAFLVFIGWGRLLDVGDWRGWVWFGGGLLLWGIACAGYLNWRFPPTGHLLPAHHSYQQMARRLFGCGLIVPGRGVRLRPAGDTNVDRFNDAAGEFWITGPDDKPFD